MFYNKVGSWYNVFQQGRVWIKISPSTWPATHYITLANVKIQNLFNEFLNFVCSTKCSLYFSLNSSLKGQKKQGHYPIHLFGEISRRGEISLKMTNIALVRALRIWVAQRMYWHILPKQGWSYILVKMSIFWKYFFAFSNVKSLSEYVVKILALKFEPKKSYGKKSKFSLCKNALIGPDLE